MPRVGETKAPLRPYWETKDGGIRLYAGDAGKVLSRLPAKSVHTIVTSPPYWNLRDYQGGPDELGTEDTPEEYVQHLVDRLSEAGRVLRNDGTLWLNLGDTYGRHPDVNAGHQGSKRDGHLIGTPWRVAFEMERRGWILRQDIVWHKPSAMPEPVKNRCSKAHEYIFLFTKRSSGYYYDWVAIQEPASGSPFVGGTVTDSDTPERTARMLSRNGDGTPLPEEKNRRSVWCIPSEGYPGAHYAVFPQRIPELCIQAGSSEYGCCSKCGAPWTRCIAEQPLTRPRPNDYVKRTGEKGTGNVIPNSVAGVEIVTITWETGCQCRAGVVPCTVLDPFVGSGTSCYVASTLGRASVGIDLNPGYLREQAIPRLEGRMLSAGKVEQLPGREAKALDWLTEE